MSTTTSSKPLFTRQQLIALLLPLIAEQALSVTIGLADTLMVSSVGEAAVSGVSLVDSFNVLMIQLLSALATGAPSSPASTSATESPKTPRRSGPDPVHHDLAQRRGRRRGRGRPPRHPAGHLRLH